jgi:predicted nucleic acid-binding protein
MVVVADTSPLTALLHLKKLYLIQMLYGEVYIPSTVAIEINSLADFGFDISFLKQRDVYLIRKAQDEILINDLKQHLDEGEAEAIALAKELNADLLLIDEKLGKQYAEAENISCKGVVGILIEAKQQGLLSVIRPLLDDLIKNLKFRLSDKIYEAALKKAGE